jgi:hypothetical protein
VNKTQFKNLLLAYDALPLPSAPKKEKQFFIKQIDFHSKMARLFKNKKAEKFGRNK